MESKMISNITPNILKLKEKNLLTGSHPLNIIKTVIFDYFQKSKITGYMGGASNATGCYRVPDVNFEIFDNLDPIVTTKQCFDDLLIPKDHPGRAPTDTYYVDENTVLRTHTSSHQSDHLKEGHNAFLVVGDVYRKDTVDASHFPVFHQMEAVKLFDKQKTSVEWVETDLKFVLEGLVRHLFGSDIKLKWSPDYFPFTEPSFELEVFWNNDWLEVLGCGIVHEQILKNTGRESKIGWAFGLGLERLAMVMFGIPDIRLFWTEDPRFHDQFKNSLKEIRAQERQFLNLGITGSLNISDFLTKFKEYSKYPSVKKDVNFLIGPDFHENDLHSLIRSVCDDLIESVELIDTFYHKKLEKTSNCYRITYRSMDRNLTHEEINEMQEKIIVKLVEDMKLEIK